MRRSSSAIQPFMLAKPQERFRILGMLSHSADTGLAPDAAVKGDAKVIPMKPSHRRIADSMQSLCLDFYSNNIPSRTEGYVSTS